MRPGPERATALNFGPGTPDLRTNPNARGMASIAAARLDDADGARPGAGQSPEGHRVSLVRSVLSQPLPPLRRLSGRQGGLGRGDRGWAQEAPNAVGHDPGLLKSRGWRRAFTLRSHFHPAHPRRRTRHATPAAMARTIRGRKGAGARRADKVGHGARRGPAQSRPGPPTGFRRLPWSCCVTIDAWAPLGQRLQTKKGQACPGRKGDCDDRPDRTRGDGL